ncbi:hypothetical protein M5K25_004897 [Dendrobium thyrsiflorum]|uniref:RNase H type-1 domain-containing protein n=1 Tax=Dendrobium thyrsiflorum TaxID=117978 RepID=A0ABD0VG18_DENTH
MLLGLKLLIGSQQLISTASTRETKLSPVRFLPPVRLLRPATLHVETTCPSRLVLLNSRFLPMISSLCSPPQSRLNQVASPHVAFLSPLTSARNDSKHSDIKMDADHVISNIRNKILQLHSVNLLSIKNFYNCIALAHEFGISSEQVVSNIMVKIVRWIKPSIPYVKLNTNGSVGPNFAGEGGLIRNEMGSILAAFAGPLKLCTVTTAELLALVQGLEM